MDPLVKSAELKINRDVQIAFYQLMINITALLIDFGTLNALHAKYVKNR